MSDLCMYKLEDIVWDEFDPTGDHIVPHHGCGHWIVPVFQGDGCKKPRHEAIGISSKAADHSTAKYVCQGKGDGAFQPLKNIRETMLEKIQKNSWSHTPEGVFPASQDSDSNKEVTSLASDYTGISNHCFKSSKIDTIGTEFYVDGSFTGQRCDVADSNSYCYSLGEISQTDNDRCFFDNDLENKVSNDILYGGWTDVANFDYADGMFSSDSTFVLGEIGNEDLSWLPSSHATEGSEGALLSDFKFSCLESSQFKDVPEQQEPSKQSSGNDSIMDSSSVSYSFPASGDGEPNAPGHLFLSGSNAVSERNDELTPQEQVCFHKKQTENHHESEGKRKDQFPQMDNMRFNDTKLTSGDSARQAFTSPNILKQEENIGPDPFCYLQTHNPRTHSEYSRSSDQIPASSTSSGIKSKTNRLLSLSAKETSYASNRVVPMEISNDCSSEAPGITVDDKTQKLSRPQGFQPSFSNNPKHVSCDPSSVSKHVRHSENGFENHSNIEGVSLRTPANLATSNIQESSCMSSELDEISPEASSFHQLQQVMEQLDTSTKLCIRDSLYRLARSAEQRHRYASLNGGSISDRDTGGSLMAEGTNSGFMEIETDTNPIDRSIAHLLFHRPMDAPAMPAHDGSYLKSHTVASSSPMGQ